VTRRWPPLARAALLVGAADVLGLRLPALLGGVLAPAVAVLLSFLALRHPHSRNGSATYVWLALAAAGLALGQATALADATDCRARAGDGAAVRLDGFVLEEPTDGAFHVRGTIQERGAPRCRGEIGVVARRALGGRSRGRIGASHGGVPRLSAGTRIRGSGHWLARPPEPPWPRPPERAGTLLLDSVRVLAAPGLEHPLLALRGTLQRRIRRLLPRQWALAEALILSRREGVDAALRDRFAAAGLAHILAISGLHVGVLAAMLLGLGRVLRLSPRAAALAAGSATMGYVAFLGAPFAATRAAVQVVFVLAARMWQRPSSPLALTAAAALALMARDPHAVLDPGFQLSFAGALAIIAWRRPLLERLPARLPAVLRDGLATNVVAAAGTGPVAAVHFGQVAPVGIAASLVAVPLVGFLVPLLGLVLMASFASTGLAHYLAGGADLTLAAVDALAGLAADVPHGHAGVGRDAAVGWAAATLLCAAILRSRSRRLRLGLLRPGVRTVVALGAATSLFLTWPLLPAALSGPGLRIYAIDVGQGDALAVRTPHGRWILIDTGPRDEHYDAGRARVVPFLRRHSAAGVDLLVLTHPDADHIGGAESILATMGATAVLDPGLAAGKDAYIGALREASHEHVHWYAARSGEDVTVDGVQLQIMAPEAAAVDVAQATNDVSVVLRVVYGGFAAFFDADAPAAVEADVVSRWGGRVAAEVLKVGHHGSRTSSSEALLNAVRPSVALISVGRRNRYGHPDPDVIERLRSHGIAVYRTDRQGTIMVRAWRDGRMEVSTAR
jgi:competence protein ComEC